MKKPGLALAILGLSKMKKKGASSEEDDAPDSSSEDSSGDSMARSYAREAYTALQDKDEDGFVEALLGLMSCGSDSESDEDE